MTDLLFWLFIGFIAAIAGYFIVGIRETKIEAKNFENWGCE